MEVHHHPQVEKRRFKEYFLEFLMIFLAVTMGFFAESLREHISENKTRNQYIGSLAEDLEADTAAMRAIIEFDDAKITALRQMYQCYDTVLKDITASSCMGDLIKFSKVNRAFEMNDRTLTQLANAGGFRLLRKQDADSILAYQRMYKKYYNFQATIYQEAQDNVRNTLNDFADFRVLAPLETASPNIGADVGESTVHGQLVFSKDRTLLNKWFNQLHLYLRVITAQRMLLGDLRMKANGLINFYHKHQ